MIKSEVLRICNNSNEKSPQYYKYYNYYTLLVVNEGKYYCTMMSTIDLCCLKKTNRYGNEYNKWPKLVELHYKLFKEELNTDSMHNSLSDIAVTARCYYKLIQNIDLYTDYKFRPYLKKIIRLPNVKQLNNPNNITNIQPSMVDTFNKNKICINSNKLNTLLNNSMSK